MQNFRQYIVAAAMILAFLSISTDTQAETLTLRKALSLAYENNFRLQAGQADLRATDEDVAKALSGWRPSASVSGTYGVETNTLNKPITVPGAHPRDFGVTVTQPIFNPAVIPQTRLAKSDVRVGRAILTSLEEQVLFDAATAYFDVLRAEENLLIQHDNAALLEHELQGMNDRFGRGDVTRTDVSLVKSRLSSAHADTAFAGSQLAAARAAFEQVIGEPAATLEKSPFIPIKIGNENGALALALAANPDLLAARGRVRSADAASDVADAALYPTLSALGQYKQSQDELARGIHDSELAAFLQVQIPIYQGGGEEATIRKSKELRTRAVMQMNDAETQVRQFVHTVWQAREAAALAIAANQEQVEASEAALAGAQEEVKAGERTTYDLLNSSQERLAARLALANSRRELAIASFRLLVVTGGLTAVALDLPVKLYDPKVHYDDDAGRWFGFGD